MSESYDRGKIDSAAVLAQIERSRTLTPTRLRELAEDHLGRSWVHAVNGTIQQGQYSAGRGYFYLEEAARREQAEEVYRARRRGS